MKANSFAIHSSISFVALHLSQDRNRCKSALQSAVSTACIRTIDLQKPDASLEGFTLALPASSGNVPAIGSIGLLVMLAGLVAAGGGRAEETGSAIVVRGL